MPLELGILVGIDWELLPEGARKSLCVDERLILSYPLLVRDGPGPAGREFEELGADGVPLLARTLLKVLDTFDADWKPELEGKTAEDSDKPEDPDGLEEPYPLYVFVKLEGF